MDMFEKKIEHDRIEVLKPIFDSTLFPRKNAHDFCCSCIQWYPIDSGIIKHIKDYIYSLFSF